MAAVQIFGRNIIIKPSGNGGGTTDPPESSPTGTRVAIYGDSITSNAGASNEANGYPAVYQGLTKLQVRTMSHYGRTVQEAATVVPKNSLENVIFSPTPEQVLYNPVFAYDADYKYLMIRTAVNDALQKPNSLTNATTFRNKYIQCLDRFIELGWPLNKLKLINIGTYHGSNQVVADAVLEYNLVIKQIGTEKNIQVIDIHAFDLTNGNLSLYADEVHPNDLGHLKHAQYLANLLP